jgi:predicted nicotinamide N-methyase
MDELTTHPLAGQFELTETTYQVLDQAFDMLRPRSVDELIDEDDFNRDERLPYWADVWPSARVLAQRVAEEPGIGRTLLELGCGVGLVALTAARAGFQVLATDYYEAACEFTRENARRNQLHAIDARIIDWRAYPDDLRSFDVVAASDVLYERAYAALVADAFAQSLAPRGLGLLTDPGRQIAQPFAEHCQARGLSVVKHTRVPVIEGTTSLTVDLFEIRRQS